MEQSRNQAYQDLYDAVNIMLQNCPIKSYKDIDFMISDLIRARETCSEIMKASSQSKIKEIIEDWIEVD